MKTAKCRRAITLIELLVAIAIIAVLSAVIFPAFASAREAARGTVCLSKFKQVATSTLLYQADYDDRFALSRYRTREGSESANDKTWVQLVLPYTRDFGQFKCPSDGTHEAESLAVFDADLVIGDTYSKYYTISKRSNLGYNYLYLSPLLIDDVIVYPMSRMSTEIEDASNMILFGDSVHHVSSEGVPSGGGNYLIVPPCRYAMTGSERVDTFDLENGETVFLDGQGWENGGEGSPITPYLSVGGLWPRHNGRLTSIFVDGHARRITLKQATSGCDVQSNWNGSIHDRGSYLWDTQ